MNANLPMIGYGLSGAAFLMLTVLLLTRWRGRLGPILAIATGLSSLWGFGFAYGSTAIVLSPLQIFLLETVHDSAWMVFLALLLSGAVSSGQLRLLRYGGLVLAGGVLATGIGAEIAAQAGWASPGAGYILIYASILTALYVLVVIEQIYRNARESQRFGLKFLCLGIGGIFSYDLFLYSNAILLGQMSGLFWAVRGIIVAMCVPLIAIGVRRSPSWSTGIFVSRQIVFYAATLFAAGMYLTVIGAFGYFIQIIGGGWVLVTQMVFFFAAFLAFFTFLLSDRARSKLRVFVNKHFYESKYDYREEWLRLISTLAAHEDGMPLKKRSIQALAKIVDGRSGLLWLGDGDGFRCVSNWNVQARESRFSDDHPLVRFLLDSGWIIDLREYESDPGHYSPLDLTDVSFDLGGVEIIVPLVQDGGLLGFVVLSLPKAAAALNFEDHDLLKTVGQQIASSLAQEQSTEQLAEHKQFEAFNKLTAFIMHDLKNLIAQQSLVVENAQKHKGNPEFIDDVIETIKGSVARMRKVIDLLKRESADQPVQKVEVGKLIMQAVSSCADRSPTPRALIGGEQVWVWADQDRLQMAFYHAIRNAQDATPRNGRVDVELASDGGTCTVSIIDNGRGMDDTFIRERLFRPFDSTKGTQGMGIGAYQIRETLRSVGGEVRVKSKPEQGTRLVLSLQVVA